MTFENTINYMREGKAAKPASWGGYVFKTDDIAGIKGFVETKPYTEGDLVRYQDTTYICIQTCEAGIWDPEDWERADKFILTFRKRLNGSDGKPVDTSYKYIPYLRNGKVEYKIEFYPTEGHEDPMPLDGAMLTAFQSDEWITGSMDDFEEARLGTSNAW